MDHAFSTRAPQTGPPPSPDWSLHQTSSSETASGFTRYSVLDAVGVRLGTISGWVRAPGGQLAGLCVALSRFEPYLIPLGYVTGVDPRHRTIHLREVTRRVLPRLGVPCADVLPPAEVLDAVLREAPAPRPEIASLFRQPEQGPLFSASTPIVVPVRRTDPTRPAPTPVEPRWRTLEQVATPPWQPLGKLGEGDDDPHPERSPRWL